MLLSPLFKKPTLKPDEAEPQKAKIQNFGSYRMFWELGDSPFWRKTEEGKKTKTENVASTGKTLPTRSRPQGF